MKKLLLFAFISYFPFQMISQEIVDKELFFLGYGQVYSLEDEALGFNFRAGIPMQKGFDFNFQATYLPNILGYGYEEFRYCFNVELTLLSIKRVAIYATSGFDFGRWKRKWSSTFVPVYNEPIKDNSLIFGGGINYNLKRASFFIEDKFLWEINRNHIAIGFRYKIFENSEFKQAYFDYLKKQSRKSNSAN